MGLDLDEWIFGSVAKYFRKKRKASDEKMAHRVELSVIKPRLIFLARAITGNAIDLFPAEREGGFKNNNFFLPKSFSLFPTWEENLSFYFYRTFYLCIQQELGLNWKKAGWSLPELL